MVGTVLKFNRKILETEENRNALHTYITEGECTDNKVEHRNSKSEAILLNGDHCYA